MIQKIAKETANAGAPFNVASRSSKVRGVSSETTSSVSANANTASLNPSSRSTSRPGQSASPRMGRHVSAMGALALGSRLWAFGTEVTARLISSADDCGALRADLSDLGLDLAGDQNRPGWRAAIPGRWSEVRAVDAARGPDTRGAAHVPAAYARRHNLRALRRRAGVLARLRGGLLGRDAHLERPHGHSVLDDATDDVDPEREVDAQRDVERPQDCRHPRRRRGHGPALLAARAARPAAGIWHARH